MLVEYIPTDSSLINITLNIGFTKVIDYTKFRDAQNRALYNNLEEVPFEEHFKNSIDMYAPHVSWDRQKFMIENAVALQAKLN